MIHFTDDAFKEVSDWSFSKLPYTAKWQLTGLWRLAQHEGITLAYLYKRELPHGYEYIPGEPVIIYPVDVPWPDLRWCLACGLGLHFTRGIYLEEEPGLCRNSARWREQGRAWATQFLATQLRDMHTSHYPNFSASGDHLEACGGPKKLSDEPPLARVRSHKREACRGRTKEGSRCSGKPTPGTAFCRHHQAQGKATFASIVEGLNYDG